MALQAGEHLGPYEIVEPLGAGGMGEVYRAKDTRLKRDVAIKVVPEHLAKDRDALIRFEREAQAIAALSHPNILAAYDVGTDGETSFVVTELLEGETLRDRLRVAALPWRKAAEIGVAIADGLAAAHIRGIIHRDLKPENIFLTRDGVVKILDFGLAHRAATAPPADPADSPTITLETAPGTLLGTAAYMSPEQVRGEQTDARSDVFALGCVLYEMVSGSRAFARKTVAETLAAILKDEPPDIAETGQQMPPELDRLIRHCLEKKPEERFQSARDLAFDLRSIESDSRGLKTAPVAVAPRSQVALWVAVSCVGVVALAAALVAVNVGGLRERWFGPTSPTIEQPIKSLAVLPLDNLSGDPEQEYFADGMTDALIGDLAKIGAMRVISRTSVMRFKGTDKPLPEIAQELNVDAIVEGSVLRAGNHVRISAKLIHGATDQNLWSDSYERELRDVLALQSQVAQAIAREIQVKLTPQEQVRFDTTRRVNPEAYEAYVKGRHFWNKRTKEALRKSITYFEEAIEKDATYALAYAGLADAHSLLASRMIVRPDEGYPRAREAALRAVELDATLAEAHASLAVVQWLYDWDLPGAEQGLKRAIALNPGYASARHWRAGILIQTGRFDEGIAEIRRAQQLDPLSLQINTAAAAFLYRARRYDEAIKECRKALDLDPGFPLARLLFGWLQAWEGNCELGIAEMKRAVALAENDPFYVGGLGCVYAMAGMEKEARRTLEEIKRSPQRRYGSAMILAVVHIGLGERDRALQYLEEAYQARDSELLDLNVDPLFDPLRGDPQFNDLLRRIGFDPSVAHQPIARPPSSKTMLAVLPFEDISPEPAEWFSDGMTEEMITQLGQLRPERLGVIARTSAMQYKGTHKGIGQIGHELGADYVLEGSVRRAANKVRITAKLIQVSDQTQIWVAPFEGELTDVFALQTDVAERVATSLAVELLPGHKAAFTRASPTSPAAHEAYLKGRFYWNKRTSTELHKALQYFQQAVESDPTYAPAHSGLADAYMMLANYRYMLPREAFLKARAAALKALELDDTLAEAHASLGQIKASYDWDLEGAEQEYRQAIRLNPNYAEAHNWYGLLLCIMGDFDAALAESEQARYLDPLSPVLRSSAAGILYRSGRYEEAERECRKALEVDPDYPWARAALGTIYRFQGEHERALAELHKVRARDGTDPYFLTQLGYTYARAGQREKAHAILHQLKELSLETHVPPACFAQLYGGLGDVDRAFEWLEKAREERDSALLLIRIEPECAPLREDPRYAELLQRMGLKPLALPTSPPEKAASSRIMLAVLPLRNLSADPEQEYFSDGITEEMIAKLGRIRPERLGVIAARSGLQYKGTTKPIRQIGEELGVGYVVDGSVRRQGERVRVTAELVRASDHAQLWADQYERELEDVFAIQTEIAEAVTEKLAIHLLPEERAALKPKRVPNPEAYQACLRGRYFWNRRTEEGFRRALEYFEEATRLDPSYAAAYAGIADCHLLMGVYEFCAWEEARPKVQAAIDRALQLEPAAGEPYATLGLLEYCEWNWAAAEQALQRSLELCPGYATAYQWYAEYLLDMGRHDEALAAVLRGRELDPLSPAIQYQVARTYLKAGRHEEALAELRTTLAMAQDIAPAHLSVGYIHYRCGDEPQAAAAFERALRILVGKRSDRVDDDIVSDFRREFQERGFQAAYRVTTGYFANHLDFPRVSPASIGFGYAFVGEREKAFAWLEKAYAQRDRGLSGLRTDPTIDSIRDDPRYHDLLRRMGLPPDERFKPAQPEPPADKIRLAVLPFENLGPADEEYFADGISDEIRSRLAAVRKLGVISRASAFQCKHIRDQRGRVGSELNVDYLIDGTIRWSRHKEDPDRVRITPELIRVSDEMVLWSKPYDGVLKDIFEVQSEIAEQVVTQLNVTLLPPERDAIEARPTDKLEAYDAYIRGLDYYSRPDYDKEDYELAIAMFNRAVSLDPSFALAYAQLSAAHSAMYHFQHDATEARAEQALAAANRARELEPSLAEAHLAHGCYQYCCRRDYDQALEALAVAQKGLPGDARILFVRAGIRRRQGRFEEALADFKSAFDLDPKNAKLAFEVGLTLASLRRHAQADCWYARAIALRPDQANAYMAKALNYLRWRGDIRAARDALESAPREGVEHVALARFYVAFLGRDWQTALDELAAAPSEGLTVEGLFLPKTLLAARVYQGRGEPDRAREAYDSARQLLEGRLREGLPDEGSIRSSLGIAFAGLGRTDDAIREGKRGVELCPGSRDVIHRYDRISNLAFIYVLVGEHDAALDQIEHLLSVPSNLSVPLLRLDPRWDPLSDHPRYKELLKRHVSEP